jgi:pimeloyl-ACP methyl ester carboxylesterase
MVGSLYDVGGYRLHLHSMGEGSTTVVLDAGGGHSALAWSLVQPEVAKLTRVCSYDRAGIGFSEDGPLPRTAATGVRELRALLQAAKIPPPYLVVGHSQGCFHARVLAARHPEIVKGVLLIDPIHEDVDERLPPAFQEARAKMRRSLDSMRKLSPLMRLLRVLPGPVGLFAAQLTRRNLRAAFAELDARDQILREMRELPHLGDVPLIVLGAGKSVASFDPRAYPKGTVERVRAVWVDLQRDLATRSRRGEYRVVADCGHAIPTVRPVAVVDAVRDLLAQAQA